MKMNKIERELVAKAIYEQRKEKDYNKAFQTKNKGDVWKNYQKTSIGKIHRKVVLAGQLEEVYRKAFNTPIVGNAEEIEITNSISELAKKITISDRVLDLKNMFFNYSEDRTLKEVKKKELSKDLTVDYAEFFDCVLASYGSKVHKIYIVTKANKEYVENNLRVVFIHRNTKLWSLDYPFVDKDCFFNTGNNMYSFMFTISNLQEIITGNEKELKLSHPYSWLTKQLLKAYTVDGEEMLYTQEFFDKIIFGIRNENCYKFQIKLSNVLRNAKDNPWDESKPTPVIWFDKHSSAISKFSFTRNILIDSCYMDLVKLGLVKGLDLLTGSTSTPAKRVKPASCWDIVRHGSELKLEKVKDSTSIIEDYAGEFKCCFPAFVKTSAKRDNSCTIKDTVDFIEPQEYQRKFRIK